MHRIEWIDIAKGLGIIFLIYGHIANNLFTQWIYTFHIPLFFFLSGFLFSARKNFKDFLISKSKSLLIPYLFLGIPMIIPNLKYFDLPYLLKCFVIQERMFPLWFISALFIQLLLAYCIIRFIKPKKYQVLVVGILAIGGILFWRLGGKSLPWNFDISLIMLPIFYLGYISRDSKHFHVMLQERNWKFHFMLFTILNLIGFISLLSLGFPPIDLFANHYGFEPLSYLTSICGILSTIVISNQVRNKILSYIGKNSLVYFAWQQDFGIYPGFHFLHITNDFILLLFTLGLMTILNEIILHTKLRFLIGKF